MARSRYRRLAMSCWVVLQVVLGLLVAGVPSVLHYVVAPHRWCVLHNQLEHEDGLPPTSSGSGTMRLQQAGESLGTASIRDGTSEDHEEGASACRVTLSSVAACAVDAVQKQPADLLESLQEGSQGPPSVLTQSDLLALAPKRSPPQSWNTHLG